MHKKEQKATEQTLTATTTKRRPIVVHN